MARSGLGLIGKTLQRSDILLYSFKKKEPLQLLTHPKQKTASILTYNGGA